MSGMSGVKPEETGLASGLINTTYQVGSAVGLAVMVALAASVAPHAGAETGSLQPGFQTAFFGAAVAAFLAQQQLWSSFLAPRRSAKSQSADGRVGPGAGPTS